MSTDEHTQRLVNQFDFFPRSFDTANWVFGDQGGLVLWHEEILGRLPYPGDHLPSDVVNTYPPSTVHSCGDECSSNCSDLDVDLLQVLEDVVLDYPPNDLARGTLFPIKEEPVDDSLAYMETSINTLILSIRKSSWRSTKFLQNSIYMERLEEHRTSDSEAKHLTITLPDMLETLFQVTYLDLEVIRIRQILSTLRQALEVQRSGANRKLNTRIIESSLDSNIWSRNLLQSIQGFWCISTKPIHGIDSVLATSEWYFYMGMVALSRSQFRFQSPPLKEYLDSAISFFFFDLQYGTDRWETWYRLAQCYEAIAEATSDFIAPIRRAIHCYMIAISSAKRTTHTHESLKTFSLLCHDFGILTYNWTPLMESKWPLGRYETCKLAINLLKLATLYFSGRWMSHFMLASYTYQMFEVTHDGQSRDLNLEIKSVLKTLKQAFHILSKSPPIILRRESRYDIHKEITLLVHWLVKRREDNSERVKVALNYSIAVFLHCRESFRSDVKAFSRSIPPVERKECLIERAPIETQFISYKPQTASRNEPQVPRGQISVKKSPSALQVTSPMSNILIDDRMQDLRRLGPEDIIQLGLLCEQQLKIKQSIACFNYLTHSPPDFVDKVSWWLKIAPMLEQSGKFDIAKKMYKLVLERNSENAEAMKNLGRLYHQENTCQENQDRAIGYLERAVALDKSNTQSWYLLGCSYLSRQLLFKAHEAFQQAIYRDQKNVDCWASLGALNVKMKRYKEAQHSYDTAIKLDRRRVASWVNLGNLMRQLGQIPKAIDSFKVASNLDPSNAEVQKYLRELIDASDG